MRGLLAVALLGGCSLLIDPPGAEHPEILVNSIPNLDQGNPVAAFANELYLVVWQDSSLTAPDTSQDAIRGRFLSKAGVPQATDLLVNDPTTSRFSQEDPRIAAVGSNMLVAWTDLSGLDGDSDSAIRARVIATTGEFLSADMLVNTTVTGVQAEPVIAPTSSDSFIVIWTDGSGTDSDGQGIRARRIGSNGAPKEAMDFVVNVTTAGNQTQPAIALGTDDRFLAVWTDTPPTGPSDIRGRLLHADGAPFGSDVIINTTRTGVQSQPWVTAMQSGYLVIWTDESLGAGDIDGTAVRARVLDRDGAGLGDDFVLNTTTRGDQGHPQAIRLLDGSIFVVFEDDSGQAPDTEGVAVRARRLDIDGAPIGDDFLVNTFYKADQEDPTLATDSDGAVLVVWEDGSTPDGSADGIQARIYSAP